MAIVMLLMVASSSVHINVPNTNALQTEDSRNLKGKHVNDGSGSTMKERQGNTCISIVKV